MPVSLCARLLILCLLVYSSSAIPDVLHYPKYFVLAKVFALIFVTNMPMKKNQNSIQEEIKSRLRSANAGYHSVQSLLSYRLLSKNLKTKIYRTII